MADLNIWRGVGYWWEDVLCFRATRALCWKWRANKSNKWVACLSGPFHHHPLHLSTAPIALSNTQNPFHRPFRPLKILPDTKSIHPQLNNSPPRLSHVFQGKNPSVSCANHPKLMQLFHIHSTEIDLNFSFSLVSLSKPGRLLYPFSVTFFLASTSSHLMTATAEKCETVSKHGEWFSGLQRETECLPCDPWQGAVPSLKSPNGQSIEASKCPIALLDMAIGPINFVYTTGKTQWIV